VNIFLTPYDILRIRRALGISSGALLSRYTHTLISSRNGLPLVALRMDQQRDLACPWVREDGCEIYPHRPWSCRMYPVETHPEQAGRFRFLVDASRCRGLAEDREWILQEWFEDQGLGSYEEMNALFQEIVSHEVLRREKITNSRIRDMFYMACYDLDRFRRFVLESRFLSLFELEPEEVKSIRTDDEALLRLALRWVRFGLFDRKAMRVRPQALQEARSHGEAASEGESS
jgi:hypothetical protein